MRLAVCALSAVLLSGCSWLGMGGHGGGHGQAGGAYGVNCAPGGGHWQQSSYAYGGGGACGVGGAYGVAGNGFGGAGAYGASGAGYGLQGAGGMYGAGGAYGMQGAGYGAGGAGYGMAGGGYGAAGGAYGAGGPGMVGAGLAANGVGGGMYGGGAYGAGGVTTLGANAAYGSAVYGGNVVGTQYANGQYVSGAGVQTIQGAPYYVPQPYPAYYGVPQLRGVGRAMPWGVETFGGTEFGIGGDVFTAKDAGPADGDPATGIAVGSIDAIGYNDAFGEGFNIGGALTHDISRNTTLIGSLGYSKKGGQTIDGYTDVTVGSYDAAGVFTPGAGETARDLDATFSDLEQWTLEGGVRQYVGYNPTFRPYVGASAGFARNNDVTLTQTYSDDGTTYNEQEYISSGWNPTAAATIGAEMAVGPRAALGVETGIRWRDGMDTNLESEDRWSIPVSLRGRVAF